MIKRILIPLDNSKYCESAIETGCYMARYYGAELTAITVLDIPGIENSVGPVPMGGSAYAKELREHKKKEAHETLEKVLKGFREKCDTENVQHRVLQESGEPAEEIINYAILYDLVVMGLKTFFHFGTSDEPGETIDKLLEHTVTPGIAVPENFQITGKEMNVLIAFDGSLPAARALRQ
ncbi:MAG: universal stress protein, partial [bacterium]|nr:universal stress protein [bacterium]